jgi:predicted TIM-barrel fold metal-dependent hydrolase
MKVISADGHIDLVFVTDDIFYHDAPDALKDRVPRRLGPFDWVFKGKQMGGAQAAAMTIQSKVMDRIKATGFDRDFKAGISRPGDPKLHAKDMDLDGVVGAVIYGVLGLDSYLAADGEALSHCYRRYAEWIAQFMKADPRRFAAVAPLAGHDVNQAVADLRFMADLGIQGIELKPRVAVKPFWHDIWEPLWAAVEEIGIPVHFHSDIGRLNVPVPPEDASNPKYKQITGGLIASHGKMANAELLGSMILSGALDRHPKLTLVMGESDLSWIPHYITRMDYCVTEREHSTGLSMLPSEYWRRQCKSTFQFDKMGVDLIGWLGEDNIMWGNDYPHPDGVWPHSREVVRIHAQNLNDRQKQKVFHDNAAKLYRLAA